jgi:5'-nucleotidase
LRVLLTNDDGVDAPGIWALHQEFSKFADVFVVAPATERSATGHAISVYNEITLSEHTREKQAWGYALDGTPADCVKMAVSHLMKDAPPDIVVSGVNRGQNTGTSIIYSGTVAAALEATMYGFRSIAVSLAVRLPFTGPQEPGVQPADARALRRLARDPGDYAVAAQFAARLARSVERRGLPEGVLLNVNVPNIPADQIRGTVISKMGSSVFVDEFRMVNEAAGVRAYKNVGDKLIHSPEGDDWDDLVLRENKISVTPLHYDMTHHRFVEELKRWMAEDDAAGRAASAEVAQGLEKDLNAEIQG